VFEIDRIDLDSTDDTANNDFNNITNPLTVVLTLARGYANIGVDGANPLAVGQLLYIGTEYLRVLSIAGNNVTFGRGRGGSTNAVHANAVSIFWSASHISGPTANIPIGIQGANQAAAVGTPIVAATINNDDGAAAQADSVDAASLGAGAVLLITSDDVGAVVLATTEVATNFAWDAVAMARGAAPARKRVFAARLTVLAGEATTTVYVPVPFTPTGASVEVRTAGATKAWTGAVSFVGAAAPMPAYVLLTDGGGTQLAAADTIDIVAWE